MDRDSPLWAVGEAVGVGLAGVVASVVVILAVGLGFAVLGIELPIVAAFVLSLVLNQYLCFGGTAIAYALYRDRDPVEYFKVRVPSLRDGAVVLGGWIGAFALVFVLALAVQALGVQTAENQSATAAVENPELFAVLIPASILVIGPGEELLFRGAVQRRLRETFGPAVSIGVASGLFAVVHVVALAGPSVGAYLTTVTILFFPAVVFGMAYEYTGNLVVSALIHGLYDATLFALLYLSTVVADGGGAGIVAALG